MREFNNGGEGDLFHLLLNDRISTVKAHAWGLGEKKINWDIIAGFSSSLS